MAFSPDSRNLGGRKEIVDRLNNHHLSLLNMKPTMNTRGPSLRFLRPKHAGPSDPFRQVRATFNAVRNIKGGTDSNCPKAFTLARKFHRLNRQTPNFALQEHLRNTRSLQRRLLRIGSMTERKKNPYDPIANPALFFRKAGDSDKTTSLVDFARRVVHSSHLSAKATAAPSPTTSQPSRLSTQVRAANPPEIGVPPPFLALPASPLELRAPSTPLPGGQRCAVSSLLSRSHTTADHATADARAEKACWCLWLEAAGQRLTSA